MSIDLDSVPPCPICGGALTEHDDRDEDDLEGWRGYYDCACGWVLRAQHQRLTYWTIGKWGRTLAQEVARLRANAEAREDVLRREPAAWICMDCGERAITDMSAHDRVCLGAAYKLEVADE